MRALIVGVKGRNAFAFREDGAFIKIKNRGDLAPGLEVTVFPEDYTLSYKIVSTLGNIIHYAEKKTSNGIR
ncbi:MAG TPA: hypothetical protein PK033_08245 [Acetivibrio sp.]|nr:hypothetical protein [Clostridium sp.]HOQ38203.1 hypothetical protein [Acetivibrio sp.]HPT91578.1 hypothetical protein [Acetivibrio sp.]HQA57851.1 hypothetical protein [Acetivibrio sp.]